MDIGVAVIVAFFVLFVFGFPVVFAILVPSIVYIAWSGIPLATIAAARALFDGFLSSGRRAGLSFLSAI